MAKPTLRHRSVTAAATRAAARRAERARADAERTERTERADRTDRAGRTGRPRPGVLRPARAEARRRDPGEKPGKPGTGSTPAAAGPAPRRGRLLAVLALLVLTALAASAVLGLRHREAELTHQARSEALAAARKAAPVILSYHHKRLDRDFAAARKHLTGSFRDEYERTTAKVVAPTAEKYKGIVKATVAGPEGGAPAASVVSSSPDRVVVLLFVNQVTESTQVSGGSRLDLNRVRMTLTRTPQGWKVSAVDAL
ncbi:hypothetical protein SUDANB106_02669 [Streptomyces sp. enrichment culture]|uniref:hypothetical protein n=1 Tax=Streptomyces sp. enrichment culture TaxID=1795815 RepID=UPI003F54E10C